MPPVQTLVTLVCRVFQTEHVTRVALMSFCFRRPGRPVRFEIEHSILDRHAMNIREDSE